LLDPGVQQLHHPRYAFDALLGAAFRGVDPPQIRPAVELRQRVEELPGVRVGRQGCGDVVGEIVALRPLGRDFHADLVAGGDPAAAVPSALPSGAEASRPKIRAKRL